MKFKVYDSVRKRYLSEEELEGQFYYNGIEGHDSSGEWEETSEFRVNLNTGKIQTEFNIALCSNPDCCNGPDLVWTDSDDFEIEIDKEVTDEDIENMLYTRSKQIYDK